MPPPIPPKPPTEFPWVIPKLVIEVTDLGHPGAVLFFDNVHPLHALKDAVIASFKWLYTSETVPTHVESIRLVLRSMEGVAHTTGSHTHKDIHFSLDHVKNSESRAREEILGVLTHEVVHCFQYNGKGQCPGGLIEGIADYVRLHAGYIPPHWKAEGGQKWDAGYQRTAYFLNWIEERYGQGTIREINYSMKDAEYIESIFKDATGRPVSKLWKLYCAHLDEKKNGIYL